MRRTVRTRFATSVVATISLAACGSSKPTTGELRGNPPAPDPAGARWIVSQNDDGTCLATGVEDPSIERQIACPDGIGIEVAAKLWQDGDDACSFVLDSCEGSACLPMPTLCPGVDPSLAGDAQ